MHLVFCMHLAAAAIVCFLKDSGGPLGSTAPPFPPLPPNTHMQDFRSSVASPLRIINAGRFRSPPLPRDVVWHVPVSGPTALGLAGFFGYLWVAGMKIMCSLHSPHCFWPVLVISTCRANPKRLRCCYSTAAGPDWPCPSPMQVYMSDNSGISYMDLGGAPSASCYSFVCNAVDEILGCQAYRLLMPDSHIMKLVRESGLPADTLNPRESLPELFDSCHRTSSLCFSPNGWSTLPFSCT